MISAHGAVNAHTHLYSGLAALGMPPPERAPTCFREILERVWWRLDRALDARTLRAAARYHVAHALLAGTTALIDHHESPAFIEGSLDVLADACESLGCRAVICYGATERNGGRDEALRGLSECGRFLRENRRALVRGAVGLHALFTVSDETVRDAAALARAWNVPLHVHVAEDRCDVDDAIARGYAGPVARLDALGALRAGDILAHGVWLSEAERAAVEARGAWLVQNPRSNANNRVGYPKGLKGMRRVALGTDGFPSDMREELAALRREAAAHGDDLDDLRRRAAEGKVLLARFFAHTDDAVHAEGGAVREVRVADRVVVREGALVTADLRAVDEEARAAAQALWGAMRELP